MSVISNQGYCHCCRTNVIFESHHSWLRDCYLCLNCNSLPRQRHIQYILDALNAGWENKKIHESSPSNSYISKYCTGYSCSQFYADIPGGELKNGVRSENLELLTFPDNSFDIFITQDVLDHVFCPDKAIREIMRVLKPGGTHIFTTPKHKGVQLSYPRSIIKDGEIIHLHKEEFHGNPIGDGKALVTWDYGDDFEFLLSHWSGHGVVTYLTKDNSLGIDGEYIEVFAIKKQPLRP